MLKLQQKKEGSNITIATTTQGRQKVATYGFKEYVGEFGDLLSITEGGAEGDIVSYSPNTYVKGHRAWDNLLMFGNVVMYDIDNHMRIEDMVAIMDSLNVNYIITTTTSHTDELHKFRLLIEGSTTALRDDMLKETYKYRLGLIANDIDSELLNVIDTKCIDTSRQYKCNTSGNQISYSRLDTGNIIDLDYYTEEAKKEKTLRLREGKALGSIVSSGKGYKNHRIATLPLYLKEYDVEMTIEEVLSESSILELGFDDNDVWTNIECPWDTHTHSANPTYLYRTHSTVGIKCHACDRNNYIHINEVGAYEIEPEYTKLPTTNLPIDTTGFLSDMKSIYEGRGLTYSDSLVESWLSGCNAMNQVISDNLYGEVSTHKQYLMSLATGGGKTTMMEVGAIRAVKSGHKVLLIATKIDTINNIMESINKQSGGAEIAMSFHGQMDNEGKGSDYYHPYAHTVHQKLKKEAERCKVSVKAYMEDYPIILITQASYTMLQEETRTESLERATKGRDLIIVDEAISFNNDISVTQEDLELLVEVKRIIDEGRWLHTDEVEFDILSSGDESFKHLVSPLLDLCKRVKEEDFKQKNIKATDELIQITDADTQMEVAVGINQALLDSINLEYDTYREHLAGLRGYFRIAINHKRLNKSGEFGGSDNSVRNPWFTSQAIEELYPKYGDIDEKLYQKYLKKHIWGVINGLIDLLEAKTFYFKRYGKIEICSATRVAPKDVAILYLDGTADVDLSGTLLQQYKDIAKLKEDAIFIELPTDVRDYSNTTIHLADVPTGRTTICKKESGEDSKKTILSGSKAQDSFNALVSSLPEFDKDDKVLFIGYKDMVSIFKGLDLGYEYDFTYWQGFYGENRWGDYNKVVMFGQPRTPDNLYYNKHMLMTGYTHAIQEADKNDKELRVYKQSIWASSVIQGINRSRTRKPIDVAGNHKPVDVYITVHTSNYPSYTDYLIKQLRKQMPNCEIKNDWELKSWTKAEPAKNKRGRPVKCDWVARIVAAVEENLHKKKGSTVTMREIANVCGMVEAGDSKPNKNWRLHVKEAEEVLKSKGIIGVRPPGKAAVFQRVGKGLMR